jgi:sensor domain CHASE-containing protein
MITKFEVASKGTLFAVAVSLISGGSTLIKEDFSSGLACMIIGIALIVVWAFLIDWQARREARETAKQEVEKLKLELERETK